MKCKHLISIFLTLCSLAECLAQTPYFRQITDKEDLPSMTVYHIYQSKKGYIWIGTEAGIYRYDGLHFKSYKVPKSQGKSFTNIQEDSRGNIYFINFVGQLFRIKNEKAQKVKLPQALNISNFKTYFIDPGDNLWLGAEKLYFRKASSSEWQTLTLDKQFVKSIKLDSKGRLWVLVYHDNIYCINSNLEILERIQTPEPLLFFSISEQGIKAISLVKSDFYEYSFSTQKWTKTWQYLVGKIPNQVIGFKYDEQGNSWILTYEGLVQHQEKVKQHKTFLKDIFISGMMQDFEGNYWFTTLGKGLFVLSNQEGLHYNRSNSNLNFEQINCLEEDHKGNIYIGTNGNRLFYLNTKTAKLNRSYLLPYGDVECLFFDKRRQELYIENNNLEVFDTKTHSNIKTLQLGNTPKALALYQDKYLVSVAGDASILYPIQPEYSTDRLTFGKKKQQSTVALAQKRGRAVCVENNNNRFWIGYADGLCFYENNEEKELKALDNQAIIAISLQTDSEGIVWVGTAQQGVFGVKNKKIIKHLDKSTGLISNLCKVRRNKKFLYIGTDKGLQVYHIKTGQSRIFNQEDGLPSNEIKDLVIQEDKVYLATNRGLSVLNKDFSTTNHQPPLIYISKVEVWDNSQELKKDYQLDYYEDNLTIYFTGLAFRSGGKFRYKYRLKGLDEQWTYTKSSNNFARYSALPSGTYTFEVKAINEDNIESKDKATVQISIAYPIWEKWWFIVLMILLFLGVVLLIFRNRLRAIRHKNRMEKALGKATLESLKLQMNPHFLFNAMSAIQRYMMRNDAHRASNYLAQFSKLMRAVLENSRSEYISLEQEIEMLKNYLTLQQIQYKGNFQYKIDIDNELDPEEIAIPPMFAQPFIENAIEHGIATLESEGLIQLSFELEADFIILKIRDNGIGLAKAKATSKAENHQSLATQITRERISLYQKSLRKNIVFNIKSDNKGTEVVFHLPYLSI